MNKKSLRSSNRENLTLVVALSRSYQQFTRSMIPVFRQADLTPSQWDILETLSSKGPLSVNDLIDSALSTSGNLDVVIKNLMNSGLVIKSISETDRRGRIVSLTKKGKDKVHWFYPMHNAALDALFDQVPLSDRRALIKSLNRFRKEIVKPETEQVRLSC